MAVSGSGCVLVLRALGLGDLLTAVPALRGLRRAWPRRRIVLAAPRPLAALLPLLDCVDAVRPTVELDAVRWDGVAPDLAVNLHGRGPRSTALVRETGARQVWAHAAPGEETGPNWRDDLHEVDRWCRLLDWYGVHSDPSELRITVPDSTRAPSEAVVIHPGASTGARRWPADRFAALARRVAAAGERVLITGSAGERGLAREVAASAGLSEEAVLAGRTELGDLASVVARARLVVCGDTGIAHLATACATRSVVLFGPVSPSLWGPPPTGRHIALWSGTTGDTFAARPDPGLLALTVDVVLDAVAEQLGAADRGAEVGVP